MIGDFSMGSKSKKAPAMTSPALAPFIPSKDAFIGRYFLSCSQKRITKKIKNIPGKKTAIEAVKPPSIPPKIPPKASPKAPLKKVPK